MFSGHGPEGRIQPPSPSGNWNADRAISRGNLGKYGLTASVERMGRLALVLGFAAFVAALVPSGMFLGMGLGGFAATMGVVAYRRRTASGWSRLAGAFGLTVALIALVLATGRFAMTWWAVGRLTDMLA